MPRKLPDLPSVVLATYKDGDNEATILYDPEDRRTYLFKAINGMAVLTSLDDAMLMLATYATTGKMI